MRHELVKCVKFILEFFTVNAKLAEMAVLASKDLTTAKKSYLRDYYWFKSPMPNQLC